jgi:hypothetical protein
VRNSDFGRLIHRIQRSDRLAFDVLARLANNEISEEERRRTKDATHLGRRPGNLPLWRNGRELNKIYEARFELVIELCHFVTLDHIFQQYAWQSRLRSRLNFSLTQFAGVGVVHEAKSLHQR